MNLLDLPKGYSLIKSIDMQNNKGDMIKIIIISLILTIAFLFIGVFIMPFSFTIDNLVVFVVQAAVIIVALVLYIILHEVVHGVFIWRFAGEKPKFGFKGMYAYAGNDKAYFDKKSYIIIALAPVVIWGIILLGLNILLPRSWFWPVYLIQLMNLSGAAGDLYVTYLAIRMPKDILVNDKGTGMSFYTKS